MKECEEKEQTTRDRLLDVAERLFAEKGYDNTCIRDLTEAANVNVASVNYHFNGKENLYLEVFRRRIHWVRERRLEAIRSATDGTGPGSLHEVIRVFVEQFIGDLFCSEGAEDFLNLTFREISHPGPAFDMVLEHMVLPFKKAMRDAIQHARPDLSDEDAFLCIASIVGQILHFVRARRIISRTTGRKYTKPFLDRIIRHITEFSLAGIGAAG